MSDLSDLKLYTTGAHDCSYLPDQQATTVFVDPHADMTPDMYSDLSEFGFRRSGEHVYRPHCASCNRCISVRIPVVSFHPSRSQKRCWKRNSDIAFTVTQAPDIDEHFAIYARYIDERHNDGDMYPAAIDQYCEFLNNPLGCTRYIEMRIRGELIACAVSDQLNNGLSAIYTYYKPEEQNRSLGKLAILYQIERAKQLSLPYLYLGYWINECEKMRYKSDYRPLQLLINQQWITAK